MTARWWRAAAALLSVAVAVVPRAARASVALDAAGCPAVSDTAVRRIVGIEIGDLLADATAGAAAGDRLEVRCTGPAAWLRATVWPAGSDHPDSTERVLRLDEFPGDAAPRALALAGIEMLAALSPSVRERIQVREAVPAPVVPAADSGRQVWVALSAIRRDFFEAGGFGGWGGRIDVAGQLGSVWLLAGDVEVAGGETSVALGEARALLVSLGGFWGLRAAGRRLGGALALGGRFGWARLEGTPSGGSGAFSGRALRPWWGPALSARGTLHSGPVAFIASLEVGVAARGAEGLAGDATVLAVGGPWLSAGVGVQF